MASSLSRESEVGASGFRASGLVNRIVGRPLALMALSLVAGIVWADWATPSPLPVLVLAGVALVLVALDVGMRLSGSLLFICAATGLLGAGLHATNIRPSPTDPMHLAARSPLTLTGGVSRVIFGGEFGQRIEISVSAAASHGANIPVKGKLLCNLPPEPEVAPGQTVLLSDVVVWSPKVITSPGQWDEKRTLARQGIHAICRAEAITILVPQPFWRAALDTAIARIRLHVVGVLRAAMPGPQKQLYADLLAGMVFGMYNVQLPRDIVEAFRNSGTVHLMVVSGAHVTLVAAAIIFLVQGIRVRLPWWIIVFVLPPLLMYSLVAGLRASVVRSLAMALLLVLSMITGRRYDFWTALSIAAIALCIADTSAPFAVGVQLTFAAVIGVVVFYPRKQGSAGREDSKVRRYVVALAGVTLGAWLLSTPIIAHHFDMLIMGGILANLIAVPLRVIVLWSGFIAVLLGSLWLPLAMIPCGVARAVLFVTLWVVQGSASIPGAAIVGFHMPLAAMMAWYVAAGVIWWVLYARTPQTVAEQAEHRQWVVVGALAVTGIGVLVAALVLTPSQYLRITVLAVGQGNCALISDTAGHHIMFDAGNGISSPAAYRPVARKIILPYLAQRGIRTLDALIMSHGDSDHCSGMVEIMKQLKVRRFATNGLTTPAQRDASEAVQTARRLGIEATTLRAGCKLKLAGGAELTVVHPSRIASGNRDEDVNNNSIAMRLTYGEVSVLFPADVKLEGEETLLTWARMHGVGLASSVLVLPHHGRNTSSTAELLDAVSPQLAVVSGAARRYMPVHPEVGARLQKRRIPLISTDIMGTVDIYTDGRRIWLRSFAAEKERGYRRGEAPAPSSPPRARLRQETISERNASASAHAPRPTSRSAEMLCARRFASWARAWGSSSSRRWMKRRAAAACSSDSSRTFAISTLAVEPPVASWSCLAAETAGCAAEGNCASRSLTTTVPAA
jgi:competence protein ComEC